MDGYLVPGINKEHYTCSKNLSNYSSLVDVRLVAGTYFEVQRTYHTNICIRIVYQVYTLKMYIVHTYGIMIMALFMIR